ncbi:phosphatidylinositol N-acetylglucosaminyltransferase subunit Y [Trichogramma pretiosum]|nr:phosphatidylinositol N-acetylglucosaminyltransferase subunit Y [Trichogramma pretiosum]
MTMYVSVHEYYLLLVLLLIPVYLFFRLWSWLGWQLFINN